PTTTPTRALQPARLPPPLPPVLPLRVPTLLARLRRPPRPTPVPYTTLFRSNARSSTAPPGTDSRAAAGVPRPWYPHGRRRGCRSPGGHTSGLQSPFDLVGRRRRQRYRSPPSRPAAGMSKIGRADV